MKIKILAEFQKTQLFRDNMSVGWQLENDNVIDDNNKFHFFKYLEVDTTWDFERNVSYIFPIFLEYQSKVAEYEKAETARKLKEQEKAFKVELKKWQDGETSRLYINLGFDYLRLRENRVETTQAVQIPLEIAKRLYISIKEGTIKEGDKLLNYTIDKVGAQIKIGCHTFQKSYLLKFGAQLN